MSSDVAAVFLSYHSAFNISKLTRNLAVGLGLVRFSGYVHFQRLRRVVFYFYSFLANIDFQQCATEANFERERLPLTWHRWVEMQLSVLYAHATKTLDNRHPSACHACGVAAILGIIVVVVEV